MKKYVGTKMLEARPMNRGEYNKYRGWTIPADENPNDEGYLVKNQDGYQSWSPQKVFEESYKDCEGMSFGIALELAKKGIKIARDGWNGRGMYVTIDKGGDYEFSEINPFFVIKNVRNSFNTWVPSVSDILAEDWVMVE